MPDFLVRKNMVPSCLRHHDHRAIFRRFQGHFSVKRGTRNSARVTIASSIAKRLTSKFEKLLSKIRQDHQGSLLQGRRRP